MPLQPNGGKLLMPVETEADVHALFAQALTLSQTAGPLTRERYRADIEDHFFYVGALRPHLFRSLQDKVVDLPEKHLAFLRFAFPTWQYLLQGAPERCVERLLQRLLSPRPDCPPHLLEAMLASIGTDAALEAMADYATKTQRPSVFRDFGFWLPPDGKRAEPRFTRQRFAARFQPVPDPLPLQELVRRPHPVGLPVSLVTEGPARDLIQQRKRTSE